MLLEIKPEIAAPVVSINLGQSSAALSVKKTFLTLKFFTFHFPLRCTRLESRLSVLLLGLTSIVNDPKSGFHSIK